jgi:hypothetical protein
MAHIFGNRHYGWQHYISSLLTASFPVSAFLFKYQKKSIGGILKLLNLI